MDPTLKTVLLMLAAAGLAYAFSRLGRNRDRKTDNALRLEALAIEAVKERDKRIDELEDSVKDLQAKSDEQTRGAIPITAAMQAMLIHKLTNDHTQEADALLKKATDKTLTPADVIEFAKALKHRTTDMNVSEAQRIAADILPGVMRLGELAKEESEKCVKVVMVTIPETETVVSQDGGTQEQERGN